MKKKNIFKICAFVVLGIFVVITFTPLLLAAPAWNNGTSVNDSYYITIDANDDTSDQAFGVFKDGIPGGGPETELFRIQEDGYVGIGTSTPAAKLVIYGSREGEVSFKLSAPRVDHQKWQNLTDDQTLEGIKILK